MSERPVRARLPLPGISSRAWEHPADKGALVALRKLKGFDTLLKALSGLVNERAVRLRKLLSTLEGEDYPADPSVVQEKGDDVERPRLTAPHGGRPRCPAARRAGRAKHSP